MILTIIKLLGAEMGERIPFTPKPLYIRPHPNANVSTWHLEIAENSNSGILSTEQIKQFKEDGFLLLENRLDENAIHSIQEDVTKAVDALVNKLYNAEKISSLYEEYDWADRMVQVCKEYTDAAVIFTKQGYLHKSMQNMYKNPVLLDIAEKLGINIPIAAHPAWNLRVKIPNHMETEVPYHQDNSYWEPRLWDMPFLTFWIPLVDATAENGALEFVRGGHLTGKTCGHTIPFKNTWYTETSPARIQTELLDEVGKSFESSVVLVPAKRGDIIIFGSTIPHRSVPNHSNGVRWSIDLRFHTAHEDNDGTSFLDYFYGLKDSLIVRDGKSSVPDFEEWAGQDRTKLQDKSMDKMEEAELDPIIIGPWMDMWNITMRNRHIDVYLLQQLKLGKIEEKCDS